ncbi:hypothetical protein JG687_00010035 [Phytophthora cactorum]|uniref:SET domain-containing protein n=1 Tax=Phytophthora cactorum TaxID=29920 RepID=A0A8T1U8D4_9STRA|nr:SET domain [Phytophthora cactorum]KAG6957363.1 hypothetical protein JG687_00010035 [Phytophthora cactorum]
MHLKTATEQNFRVGIDAQYGGSKLRMMNHACSPATQFHKVRTGRQLMVVVVTVRDIYFGQEITMASGFLCRCEWPG